MKENYKLSCQVVARILLVLFLLESCHNNITPIALQENKIEEISHLRLQRADLSNEEDLQYIADGGHVVSLYQEGDNLQARVKENLPVGFSKSHILPVYISDNISLREVAQLPEAGQKRVIEVRLPKNTQSGHVYIGKRGLLGGMLEGDDYPEKEKEEGYKPLRQDKRKREKVETKEQINLQAKRGRINSYQHLLIDKISFKEEATRLGHFRVLPIELLQMILSYVSCPYILDVIKVNHTFYELITGYTKVGLIGVENRPNPVFHCNSWLIDKHINFKRQSPESVPSMSFYCFIGKVSDVSECLWLYLQDTKIHTLDLGYNYIGAEGGEALAKALPGTEIHTLDLSGNEIGAEGAESLAESLQETKIHTLNLGGYLFTSNKIGDQGAQALAKALPDTKIHTLDLHYNQIGDQGAEALATALPGTKIHTLDLRRNEIGNQGAEALATALPGTKIHTLNLEANEIGAKGAQALAKALPDTNIHTLNLSWNQIEAEMQDLLKKKFPHIKFWF